MLKTKLKYILFISLFTSTLSAQGVRFQLGNWKHTALNGSVELQGLYRSQKTTLASGLEEQPVSKKFNAAFTINSNSFIWHPNFLKLNIAAEYHPATSSEEFLVIPNRSETRTAEQIRINTQFYDKRPLSFNLFYNFAHNYLNREFTSNSEMFKNDFGANLSFRNKTLPVTLRYLKSDWQQNEFPSGRQFTNERNNLTLDLSKSFLNTDNHKMQYAYDNYKRTYADSLRFSNKIHSIRMQNRMQIGEEKKNNWNSFLVFRNQTGAQEYNRLHLNERLVYNLPNNFRSTGSYNYVFYDQTGLNSQQHHLITKLEHQLFLSLHSSASYEHMRYYQTNYDDIAHLGILSFNYKKQIPWGQLNLSYTYHLRYDNRDSEPFNLLIAAEAHNLEDGTIELLDNTGIFSESVQVFDETGTILYVANRDYILIERDNYLEIQRIAGGMIAEGQTVYVSYQAKQAFDYSYQTHSNIFRSSVSLFKNLLELYIHLQKQDYSNIETQSNKILKEINQRRLGLQISKGSFRAGYEYDDYESNIIPYRSSRFFINLNKNFNRQFSAILNNSWRDYYFESDKRKQQFLEINGSIIYHFNTFTQLRMDGGYRYQDGQGIDLDLINLRTEISSRFRAVFITTGFEIYRRNYCNEKINYNGGYIKVERKF